MKRKNANPGVCQPQASIEEAVRSILEDEGVLDGCSFELDVLENIDAVFLDFTRCTFRRVQFSALRIDRVHFTDCRFEQCDLSGLPFRDGTATRVEFIGCRGTGTNFDRMKMKDVLFRDCQLNYMTVSDCRMERCEFLDCDLTHCMLFGTQQKDTVLQNCRLARAEINTTSLGGVDLSSCDLDGVIAQPEMLKGSTVSLAQTPALMTLFGISVKL